MENKNLLEKLKKLSEKEISLSMLCQELKLNAYEILALAGELRKEGINISTKKLDDDIYLFNRGEVETKDENDYEFTTDENGEFKFVAISDTRFGSKAQQLSILMIFILRLMKWDIKTLFTVVILQKVFTLLLFHIMMIQIFLMIH